MRKLSFLYLEFLVFSHAFSYFWPAIIISAVLSLVFIDFFVEKSYDIYRNKTRLNFFFDNGEEPNKYFVWLFRLSEI